MSEYVKYAKEALSRPDSFIWFGDDDMFHTWGWAGINYTGHENLADISNWYSTIAELKREFGEDAYVENFDETRISHFACGYVYQLRVRILNEDIPHYEITDEDITPYFKFVCDIATYLKYEYPVLDDSDYSDPYKMFGHFKNLSVHDPNKKPIIYKNLKNNDNISVNSSSTDLKDELASIIYENVEKKDLV